MEIRSLDNTWLLTFSANDTESEYLPSVNVSVALDGEFAARNPTIWYEYEAITDFVSGLRQLESSRSGDASLDSMSPGECAIRIE